MGEGEKRGGGRGRVLIVVDGKNREGKNRIKLRSKFNVIYIVYNNKNFTRVSLFLKSVIYPAIAISHEIDNAEGV